MMRLTRPLLSACALLYVPLHAMHGQAPDTTPPRFDRVERQQAGDMDGVAQPYELLTVFLKDDDVVSVVARLEDRGVGELRRQSDGRWVLLWRPPDGGGWTLTLEARDAAANMSAVRYTFAAAALQAPAGPPPVKRPLTYEGDTGPPWAALYEVLPVEAGCRPGRLRDTERFAVLKRVEQVRALHRLPPVAYAPEFDEQTAAAALIMAANGRLSHHPTVGAWKCWSAAGAEGAGSSNLHLGRGSALEGRPSTGAVDSWVRDHGVPSVGHRRWILDPFLGAVSFGRADLASPGGGTHHAAALKPVAGSAAPEGVPFVAYPYLDYPAELFEPGRTAASFSVLADPTDRWRNRDADFGDARIRVTGPDGPVPVREVAHDNESFGLPNRLSWHMEAVRAGVEYEVVIEGVRVRGEARSYRYTFRIMR
ncbi:MAG: CAP domain-containing protein [Gemmatimonadetes bacterium]|nr:CAP domain-containing protein [Gemmatimonadota bacterium]